MYLLDTDILIWILRNKKDIIEKVSRLKEESPLSIADCIIAATANAHNLTVVSLNIKHFPMQDITLLKNIK